nr:BBA14 family lipoprotein [Borreliella turdi]
MVCQSYANKYYTNEKFPSFENFNPLFNHENDIEDTNILKNRIEYYKRYINKTEPIVIECYKKHSKR